MADLAFEELAEGGSQLAREGALGISFTEDGKQVDYWNFADAGDGSGEHPSGPLSPEK